MAKVRFPQYADSFDLYNLISMAIYDDNDRIEFQCVYDSKINEALELWAAPVKVRCGQGHTDDVLKTRSNEVLAKLIFCRPDHTHRYNRRLTAHGNKDIPPRLHHRTREEAARSIMANGLLVGPNPKGTPFSPSYLWETRRRCQVCVQIGPSKFVSLHRRSRASTYS